MHTNKIKSVTVLSLVAMSLFVLSGCDGCKKNADDVIDVAVDEYLFKGFYKSGLGPTIEVDGDEAVIVDFGYSDLGENPAAIGIGDPYIKNIEKVGANKYEGDIVQRENDNTGKLKSVSYTHTEISVSKGAFNLSVYDSPYSSFVETKDPGTGGGGNNGGECYEGTWYSNACGKNGENDRGVVWTFNNGRGTFSNKDCNGVCDPRVFEFSYTIIGNTMTCVYDAEQKPINCGGTPYPLKTPSQNGVFTFECQGNKLLVNSGNGPNTFTR